MKYFIFKVDGIIRWESPLESEQCTANNAKGHRCGRNTVIGLGLCWSHAMSIKHIRILNSTIPHAGKGLFCKDPKKRANEIVFKKGENIIDYGGEMIDENQLNQRYGIYTAPYGIEVKANPLTYEDAATERGFGSLINHSTVQARCNVKFIISPATATLPRRIKIRAIKNIKNGQELIINYGDEYQFDEEGVSYKTK